MAVPKIIHQIWLGGECPRDYLASALHFKALNPEYQYMFWDESNIPESRFPHIYDSFKYIQFKTDLIRYEILERYGGVYCDLDVIWIRPIEQLIRNKSYLFAKEYPKKSDHSLTNCLVCCEPNSDILQSIFARIETEWERYRHDDMKEIDFGHRVTGPWMVTKLCREEYPNAWYDDLSIKTIYPSFMFKKHVLRLGDLPHESFAAHCVNHAGELWKAMKTRSSIARDMIRELPAWGEIHDSKETASDLVGRLRS